MRANEPANAATERRLKAGGSMKMAIWGGTLTVVFGAMVGVILAEIVLRIAGVEYSRRSTTDFHRGTAYIPGITFRSSREGEALVEINQWGFRDAHRTLEKPPGVFRIAVLGDSYVDAGQVARDRRFTEVLEKELNARDCHRGERVEVLNFGKSGYGTVQEFMTLRHHGWQFGPDLVILAFLTGNDLRNNSKVLQNDPGRPYFILRDEQLVFDDSFRQSPDYVKTRFERFCYALIDRSRLLQVMNQARISLEKRHERSAVLEALEVRLEEVGLDSMVYREPDDDLWREAWKITEKLLALMHEEVEQYGAEFLVVTLSNASQVNPDPEARREFMEKLGVDTLFYPDSRLKRIGDENGFEVLNLAPTFLEYASRKNVFLHGFANTKMGSGHWNERGHELAAKTIADFLCVRSMGSSEE